VSSTSRNRDESVTTGLLYRERVRVFQPSAP
jgi:hypothetical protein